MLTVRRRIVKRVHHHRRVVHRTIVIARGHYRIASGHIRQIAVKLNRKGRRLLKAAGRHSEQHRRRRRLRARAKATLKGGHTAHRAIVLSARGQGRRSVKAGR